jgi:hypothetical protein
VELAVGQEQTRISRHAALDAPAYAAFFSESRMKFVNATKLEGKSGVAEGESLP